MILILLVISNMALAIYLFQDDHINWEQFLVATCSLFAVADVLIPKGNMLKSTHAVPVLFLVGITAVTPIPHTGHHEFVMKHSPACGVDKRSARGRLKVTER